jgi:hypothetical protein
MSISSEVRPSYPGRLYLALGLLLSAAGLVGYYAQLSAHRLAAPWYLPVSATLGVVFVAASLWQARTILRILCLLLVLLFAGAEWAFILTTRLPAYSGPVTVGQPFPAFATRKADDTPFTQTDLEGQQKNVLVFFRGRW